MNFELYPVVGICGERKFKIGYGNHIANTKLFLDACWKAGSKRAVIIYLYMSDGGDPALNYNKQ